MSNKPPTALNPKSFPNIGNTYWPGGLPEGSSNPVIKDEYIDYETKETFFICYTKKQIRHEVKRWGYFSPYMPLVVLTG